MAVGPTLCAPLSHSPLISIGLALADPWQREGEPCEARTHTHTHTHTQSALSVSPGQSKGLSWVLCRVSRLVLSVPP